MLRDSQFYACEARVCRNVSRPDRHADGWRAFHTGTAGRIGPIVKRALATSGGAASAHSRLLAFVGASRALTTALAESLLSGRVYVNFHTAANPGGEIRGPLDLTTGVGFSVSLDGSKETPPVTTTARSSGYAILNGQRSDLLYRFTYQGLSGTLTAGGHFHTGQSGKSGPVVKGIALSGDPASASVNGDWSSAAGTQPMTPALVDSLLAGKIYANFHTATNPSGEIRGPAGVSTIAATSVGRENIELPGALVLHQNYPNPFNHSYRHHIPGIRTGGAHSV